MNMTFFLVFFRLKLLDFNDNISNKTFFNIKFEEFWGIIFSYNSNNTLLKLLFLLFITLILLLKDLSQ